MGALLGRTDLSAGFRALALRRTRELFVELLDALEGVHESGITPVAAGVPPRSVVEGGDELSSAPPTVPPGGADSITPVSVNAPLPSKEGVGPALATSKAKAGPPPPSETPAAEALAAEEKLPKSEGIANTTQEEARESPAKKKKEKGHKDKKPKRSKSKKTKRVEKTPVKAESEPEEVTASRSSRNRRRERRDSRGRGREEKARSVSVVRDSEARRAERGDRRGEREKDRSRTERGRRSSRSRSRRRDRRRSSPGERERDWGRGTGSSRGHLPPPEPARPPSSWHVAPEPPPGRFYSTPVNNTYWRGYRAWPSSKGVKRRQRAEDIRTHGLDPQRKAQRERRDRR